MKKTWIFSVLVLLLFSVSAVMAQDSVRVKCGQFTVNVPSANVQCYQIEGNIPVAEDAAPNEIANAQVASFIIFFTDYSYKTTRIDPQIIFYRVSDLEKTSFSLLDLSMDLTDIINNVSAGYQTLEDAVDTIPFLPYQEVERLVTVLPKQIDFENGTGFRTVVTFDDSIDAAETSSNLYYSFQGMSSDETWYISAVFPLQSVELNWMRTEDVDWSSVTGEDFYPSLAELDYYIHSIVIE